MLKHIFAPVVCGALLLSGNVAFAQSYNGREGQDRSAEQRQQPEVNSHRGMYEQGRREGWYKRGGRLPSAYREKKYVVGDWRAYHLRQPPRGYHWVRSDNGDYLLVAIASGLIASIVTAALQR